MFLVPTLSSPGQTLGGTATYCLCSGFWKQPVSIGYCHCFHPPLSHPCEPHTEASGEHELTFPILITQDTISQAGIWGAACP